MGMTMLSGQLLRKGYTIRSGYDWLIASKPVQSWSIIVWNNWNIPKHFILTWLIMNDGMNFKGKLFKWGCCDDDLCYLCHREIETTEHLFLACEYSCRVSTEVESWMGTTFPTLNSLINGNKKHLQWRVLAVVLNAVYYNVWMQRNNARVNAMILRPEHVAKRIKDMVAKRLKFKLGGNSDQNAIFWMRNIGI
ncbi:uncharacterized protein LOC141601335 [Silene latifolia]|uniref:uncharacterized protein LOC141601335 n=1 Tax=Silene latifolia TaxID=37657 RepID=UPI003D78488C